MSGEKLSDGSTSDAARRFAVELQAMQGKLHKAGFPSAARAVNEAMNTLGWEAADRIIRHLPDTATGGERG
jgi:hypothetical protein